MVNPVDVHQSVEECWAEIDGHRMHYLRAGRGAPLLLIHGLMGYSFSWRMNIEALSRHASVYAPDLLGIGFSDRVAGLDCSLRATARRLFQFLEVVGLGEVDVLGTSHGGAVAVMMAAQDAGASTRRVRRLVLVAPVNPWSSHRRLLTRVLATRLGALCFRGVAPLLPPLHGYFLRRMYGVASRVPPGSVEGYSRALRVPGTTNYLLGVMGCWHAGLEELKSAYARVAAPTLLVWGSRDPVVLPESAERVRQTMVRARLVMMDGVGHLPYEEAPEEFNRLVLNFLRGG